MMANSLALVLLYSKVFALFSLVVRRPWMVGDRVLESVRIHAFGMKKCLNFLFNVEIVFYLLFLLLFFYVFVPLLSVTLPCSAFVPFSGPV